MRIMFYCVQKAKQGGETPIMDVRQSYQRLDPKIRQKFEDLGVLYCRNYVEGVDVSWQAFFQTDDRSVVERYCKAADIQCEWKSDGTLRTSQRRKAVTVHPDTGEKLFFNQIQLHHVACLDPKVREALLAMMPEEDLPRTCYFGDGSPIPDEVMHEIGEMYDDIAAVGEWEEGDIVMLDNMLAAHARNAFVGPRKIVVAIGNMAGKVVSSHDL
jgi:alpha-ketoglutarate-dependent taurine dioxygenase